MSKKILLVTGEASGDLYGSHLLRSIKIFHPEVDFFGIGGEHLRASGMRLLFHSKYLSVVGITEVFIKTPYILKAFNILKESIDKEKPDLVILIDFPDFNLRVARFVHKKGIPIVYYISPQIWAWRPKRIRTIAKTVRKMIVLFQFELKLYDGAGIDVEWIGHPLLDLVKPTLPKETAFRQFGLSPEKTTIALLPGSRMHEVKRLLPSLIESAKILISKIPDLQFIIPLASGISKSYVSNFLKNCYPPVKVVEGLTYDVMNVSELLITASGTATLEGALLEKPMVIIYKVSLLSYLIGRLMIKVDRIGLVNLVAGKKIVPELIQKDACPRRISEEALYILKNPHIYRKIKEELSEIRLRLGEPGASERAARIITTLLY